MLYATAVELVPLGNSGLQVSRLCLGTMGFGWTATEEASFGVLDAFVAAGGNFVDTADIYSYWVRGHFGGDSERVIGRWLAARGGRDRLVIATKVRGRMWKGADGEGLSRSHIVKAAEASLRRLHVETIDLYQCHRFDEKTPIDETLRALQDLVRDGKVRAIGASNYPPAQLTEALDVAREAGLPGFATLQPHYNLVHRGEFEGELQRICVERGLGVIPYSPLAKGLLTGKYVKGAQVESARARQVAQYANDAAWAVVDAVRTIAAVRGATCSAVALAWGLAQPAITALIVGANNAEQLAEQVPALQLALTGDERAMLEAASRPFAGSGT